MSRINNKISHQTGVEVGLLKEGIMAAGLIEEGVAQEAAEDEAEEEAEAVHDQSSLVERG